MNPRLLQFLTILILLSYLPIQAQSIEWQQLDRGLDFAEVKTPKKALVADGIITILRIDPVHYEFRLLAASENGGQPRTAQKWCRDLQLIAAVNAGMFQIDGLSNVGFMKNYGHVNQKRYNKDNTLVAFNRNNDTVPRFQIIDRSCQDWEKLVGQYESVSQGIRMVDCGQKNMWSQQPRIWSMVVIGKDKSGRALFIFCRSPFSVHDFIDMLIGLDIGLYNAMYLEGGPEASLFLDVPECKRDLFGSYETGFYESDGNSRAWPIPNVIGIVKRTKK